MRSADVKVGEDYWVYTGYGIMRDWEPEHAVKDDMAEKHRWECVAVNIQRPHDSQKPVVTGALSIPRDSINVSEVKRGGNGILFKQGDYYILTNGRKVIDRFDRVVESAKARVERKREVAEATAATRRQVVHEFSSRFGFLPNTSQVPDGAPANLRYETSNSDLRQYVWAFDQGVALATVKAKEAG